MNDESKKLREMLERATEPGDEITDDLDPETAALRSGWLGLCKLLEGEQRPGDSHREQPVVIHAVQLAETVPEAPRGARAKRSLWITAAVAASLLIAASVAIAIRVVNRSNPPGPADSQQVARSGNPVKPSSETAATPAQIPNLAPVDHSDPKIASNADRWQWGDSVDDEIAAVDKATTLAQQDWYTQSSGIVSIQSGLDSLEQEMNQGTL